MNRAFIDVIPKYRKKNNNKDMQLFFPAFYMVLGFFAVLTRGMS